MQNLSREIFAEEKAAPIVQPATQQQKRNETPILYSRNLDSLKANKKKVKVGLFFPFSGKNRDLGWSLYNAAVLSLFDNDINHNIELVLIDSKDTPSDPAKSIKEVTDQDIKMVVGPVFSSSVENVAKDFMNSSVTAISLSNNQQLNGKVNNNGGVFIAGFLPEQQLDKVVSHAIDHNKITFAILAPNNQYGLTVASMFKRIVKTRDGTIITSEFYDPAGADLNKVVERLVNASMVPAHLSEGRGNKVKNVVIKDSDRTYPQVILIPESGKTLAKITALIKQYNTQEREYQIIGTGQWDDVSTLNTDGLFGAWFAAPEHARFSNFEKSYYQTYNKFPPRIASIAYDSVAAIAELIDKKGGQLPASGDFIAYSNPQRNGFTGIDGGFRFLGNGLVQRNLAVLQVGSGEFVTINKPAEMFLKYSN